VNAASNPFQVRFWDPVVVENDPGAGLKDNLAGGLSSQGQLADSDQQQRRY